MGYRGGRLVRLGIWLLVFGSGAVLFDYLYGYLSGIANVREDARKFRSEAATLRTSTRALVPSVLHEYPDPYRPERDALIRDGIPRRFATTPGGTVSPGAPDQGAGKRILFLGGSTTECNEVDEAYRFPAVVAASLRGSGASVSTVNAGVRGHTTLDAINTLLNRPDLGPADVVVLMENINDRLRLALKRGYGAELSDAAPTSFAAVRSALGATLHSTGEYLAYQSNVLFLMQGLSERFGAPRDTQGGWVTERTLDELPLPSPEAQELYAQNLRVFVAVVRAQGKTPVLMTQPLGRRSPAQDLFNERVRAVSRETSAMLIDLDAELSSDRGWAFLDDAIHLNNRGALAVGQLIASKVAPLIGAAYAAPTPDTGLANLSALAERCLPPSTGGPGAGQLRIHQIIGDTGRYPSVSPDEEWLLFQSRIGAFDRMRALRIADHRLFELSPQNGTTHERHPAFLTASAERLEVVFGAGLVGEKGGRERLFVRTWPDGRTMPLYADEKLSGSIPSVQGASVFFAGSKDEDGSRAPNIYRFDRASGRVERLTKSPAEEWRPYPSPSGDVYFISEPSGRFAIHRRDGRTGESRSIIASKADEWDPAISPDGKWIAFASKRHGSWDIFIAATENSTAVRRLTELPGDEWDPSWHPSGKLLVFGASTSREPKIMALCPFGEAARVP